MHQGCIFVPTSPRDVPHWFPYYRMTRKWLPVVGYEDCYEVSSDGLVRSLDRYVRNNKRSRDYMKRGRELKPQVNTSGYHAVHLCKDGNEKRFLVHRLVLSVFVSSPPFKGCVANHKDSNRTNNNVDNLEWCTVTENNRHAIKHGNSKPWLNSPFKKGCTPWNKGKALVSVLPPTNE